MSEIKPEVSRLVERYRSGDLSQRELLWKLFEMGYVDQKELEDWTDINPSSIRARLSEWRKAGEQAQKSKEKDVMDKITYKDFITLRERFKEDGVLGEESFPSIPGGTASSTP